MELDVIVLGTGAAGLTAAIVADAHGAGVGVLEKGVEVGGTSAWSGGLVWIPNNPHMAELEIPDSREEALAYLASMSHGMIEPELAAAYVDAGPEMVTFMEANSPVVFRTIPDFPDYHPEFPGGKPGGVAHSNVPSFHSKNWASGPGGSPSGGRWAATRASVKARSAAYTPLPREELARRRDNDERGYGEALVGRLLKGCLDRGIEPRTGARAVELVMDGGRVAGVRFESREGIFKVGARGGVVLGA